MKKAFLALILLTVLAVCLTVPEDKRAWTLVPELIGKIPGSKQATSVDTTHIATCDDESLKLFDTQDSTIKTISFPKPMYCGGLLKVDNNTVATLGNGSEYLFSLKDQKLLKIPAVTPSFSPFEPVVLDDGRILYSIEGFEAETRFWRIEILNPHTRKIKRIQPQEPSGLVQAVASLPKNRAILVNSEGQVGALYLFDGSKNSYSFVARLDPLKKKLTCASGKSSYLSTPDYLSRGFATITALGPSGLLLTPINSRYAYRLNLDQCTIGIVNSPPCRIESERPYSDSKGRIYESDTSFHGGQSVFKCGSKILMWPEGPLRQPQTSGVAGFSGAFISAPLPELAYCNTLSEFDPNKNTFKVLGAVQSLHMGAQPFCHQNQLHFLDQGKIYRVKL